MTGNMNENHAKGIAKQVEKFVSEHSNPLSKSHIGNIRTVSLPFGKICAV